MLLTIIKFLYGFPLDEDFLLDDDKIINSIRINYQDKHGILFLTVLLLYLSLVIIYILINFIIR
jgi:hypothetical protein